MLPSSVRNQAESPIKTAIKIGAGQARLSTVWTCAATGPSRPPRAFDELPRCGAGWHAFGQHLNAVDEHVAHSGGILGRLSESSVIGDGEGVEQHHVGCHAGCQPPAIAESEISCGQQRQATDRIGQRRDLFVANIFAEKAGESALGAGMGARFEEHAFGR